MKPPAIKPSKGCVLIVGTVRNCEATLDADIRRIEQAFGGFGSRHWLLVESDSNDRSLAILSRLKSEIKNFDYITHGNLRKAHPIRTDRLAICRNSYVDALHRDETYSEIDFVAVVDWDGVNTLLTQAAIESCWDRDVEWDMCAANQSAPYYDVWALRHALLSPNDCYKQARFLREVGVMQEERLLAAVYSRMIKIPEDSNWIEVDSAFGGLAIYKRNLFAGVSYCGLDDENEAICEHVSLHVQMRQNGARLYINPMLINAGYTEHSKPKWFSYKIRRKLKGTKGKMKRLLFPT